MSILRSQLFQVSRRPQKLDRDASSIFDPVRDWWIMHNPIFEGHRISSESEGTERELKARAVLTTYWSIGSIVMVGCEWEGGSTVASASRFGRGGRGEGLHSLNSN